MNKVTLLNVKVNNVAKEDALTYMESLIENRRTSYAVFVNTDVIIKAEKNHRLREILNRADVSLTDGKPLIWISRWLGAPICEKVSGSDLIPELCALAAKRGWKIFILGGAEGVPEKAAENLKKKYSDICIAGTYSPHYRFENDTKELERIHKKIMEAAPDILIVSFGCPKQEFFVYKYYKNCGAVLSVCGGATVDFLAGNIRRCPAWVREMGFEWFFRFLMEPKRLFKRYFIDDIKILQLIWKYWPRNRQNREE